MASAEAKTELSYAEYLQLEQDSGSKHEWLRGEAWAMAGATPRHNAVAMNLTETLLLELAGGPCRPWGSDQKIRVEATDLSAYPDLSVICGELEVSERDPLAAVNPILVCEVLSDSTRDFDLGSKLLHYKQIPSLRDVLLIDPDRPFVTWWHRGDDGWVGRDVQAGAVELTALGASLPLERLYRGVGAAG